jgi:hypothetical protein
MPLPILVLTAALGASLAVTVSEAVPKFDVEASCRAAARANEAIGLADSESTKNCIRDEEEARSELVQKWASFSAADRTRCVGETIAGGDSPRRRYPHVLANDPGCRGPKCVPSWSEQETKGGLIAMQGPLGAACCLVG